MSQLNRSYPFFFFFFFFFFSGLLNLGDPETCLFHGGIHKVFLEKK
ncbi:hypothetical protein OIU76_009815 [Salix suchowensis]|nr:hypothetical protein OIU76_009815 [Salix suchowensis]